MYFSKGILIHLGIDNLHIRNNHLSILNIIKESAMLRRILGVVLFTFIIQGCQITTLTTALSPEIIVEEETATKEESTVIITEKIAAINKTSKKKAQLELTTETTAAISKAATNKTRSEITTETTTGISKTPTNKARSEITTETTTSISKTSTNKARAAITTEATAGISKTPTNKVHVGEIVISTTISAIKLPPIHSITFQQTNANAKNKKYTLLNKIQKKSDNTSFFFGSLPHGEYKISGIGVYLSGKVTALKVNGLNVISHFVITKNTRTDLGRLIVSEMHSSEDVTLGRSQLVKKNNALVDNYYKKRALIHNIYCLYRLVSTS